MSPGPTRVLQNVGDKLEGFIASSSWTSVIVIITCPPVGKTAFETMVRSSFGAQTGNQIGQARDRDLLLCMQKNGFGLGFSRRDRDSQGQHLVDRGSSRVDREYSVPYDGPQVTKMMARPLPWPKRQGGA